MLHTLTRSLRENKGPALVTVLLSALEVVFEIVIPLFMSNLIDFGIEGGSMAAVWEVRRIFAAAGGVPAGDRCARSAHCRARIRRLCGKPARGYVRQCADVRFFEHRQVFHRVHRHAPDDGHHECAKCIPDAHAHGDPRAGHAGLFHGRVVSHQPRHLDDVSHHSADSRAGALFHHPQRVPGLFARFPHV